MRFEDGMENVVVLDVKEGIVEVVWFSASFGFGGVSDDDTME